MATIQKLNNTTISTGTKLYKDPLMNSGVLVMYDFLRSGCWNGENPSASNNTVLDLSPNANNGTVENPTSGATYSDGLVFATGTTYITLPTLDLTSKSVLVTIWYKYGTQTVSTAGLFGNLNNDLSGGQFGYYVGTGHGTQLKGRLKEDDGAPPTGWDDTVKGSHTVGDIVQASFVVDIGDGETAYKAIYQDDTNGYKVDQSIRDSGANGLNDSANTISIAGFGDGDRLGFRGTIYRVMIEDLTTSGEDATRRIQADWEANRARFS